MAKHAANPSALRGADPKIEGLREKVVKDFFKLTDKVIKHIEWSITAVKPCVHCDLKGIAKAKDDSGNCAMCSGKGVVPDTAQRNWATEEIGARIAPKPKAVEMSVDQTIERKELEKEVSSLSDEELNTQLIALNVVGK